MTNLAAWPARVTALPRTQRALKSVFRCSVSKKLSVSISTTEAGVSWIIFVWLFVAIGPICSVFLYSVPVGCIEKTMKLRNFQKLNTKACLELSRGDGSQKTEYISLIPDP